MSESRDQSEAAADGPAAERLLIRMARRFGVDRAVGFAVLARVWQLLTGPVTQLLIVFCLSRAAQDYYYAILGMLGLQVFLELGLHVVLINIASHEWSDLALEDGRLVGDPGALSRLVSLGRTATGWYLVVAALFAIVVAIAGAEFFADSAADRPDDQARAAVSWFLPWTAAVAAHALLLVTMPLTAILEGCHQLGPINRVRFRSAVAGTLVVWAVLASGGGLWALVASAIVRLAGELWLIAGVYPRFFEAFRQPSADETIEWKREVLPLQWRAAIQGPLLWMATMLPGLMIFRRFGEGESGRLAMTWTILTAAQAASLAWVETRRPLFGTLIAQRRFDELDHQFFRLSRLSFGLLAAAAAGLVGLVSVLGLRDEWLAERIAERLLPPGAAALLALGFLAYHPALCVNIYVRAHKRDPFLMASVVSSVSLAGLQLWLGSRQGTLGVALGYLIGVAGLQTPLWLLIWKQTRQDWHHEETAE